MNQMQDKELVDVMLGWLWSFPALATLIYFMAIDIVTGFTAACISKTVSSATSYNGMLKKVTMLAMVAAGMGMEQLYADVPMGKVVATFLCFTELISITENLARAGIPIPAPWIDTLARLKGDHGPGPRPMISVGITPVVPPGTTTTTTITQPPGPGMATQTKTTVETVPSDSQVLKHSDATHLDSVHS